MRSTSPTSATGSSAGLAAIAFLAIGVAEPSLLVPCLAVAGACLGFLAYNVPPASIFLGDAGSNVLGFVLAALLLAALRKPDSTMVGIQAALFVGRTAVRARLRHGRAGAPG